MRCTRLDRCRVSVRPAETTFERPRARGKRATLLERLVLKLPFPLVLGRELGQLDVAGVGCAVRGASRELDVAVVGILVGRVGGRATHEGRELVGKVGREVGRHGAVAEGADGHCRRTDVSHRHWWGSRDRLYARCWVLVGESPRSESWEDASASCGMTAAWAGSLIGVGYPAAAWSKPNERVRGEKTSGGDAPTRAHAMSGESSRSLSSPRQDSLCRLYYAS